MGRLGRRLDNNGRVRLSKLFVRDKIFKNKPLFTKTPVSVVSSKYFTKIEDS
jgi:hypothetical protein